MLLIEAFGTIREIQLNNESLTIDNGHVVAWSQSLDYHIHTDSGWLQSIGTGEGRVNTFTGTGKVYVQSLKLETFAGVLQPYLPTSSNASFFGSPYGEPISWGPSPQTPIHT